MLEGGKFTSVQILGLDAFLWGRLHRYYKVEPVGAPLMSSVSALMSGQYVSGK